METKEGKLAPGEGCVLLPSNIMLGAGTESPATPIMGNEKAPGICANHAYAAAAAAAASIAACIWPSPASSATPAPSLVPRVSVLVPRSSVGARMAGVLVNPDMAEDWMRAGTCTGTGTQMGRTGDSEGAREWDDPPGRRTPLGEAEAETEAEVRGIVRGAFALFATK